MGTRATYIPGTGWRSIRLLAFMAGSVVLAALAGCGSSKSSTPVVPAGTTALQINMGDAPADWLLSFSMKVSSISLKTASGETFAVSSNTIPVEMIQRLGTMEPVALVAAPRQTYSGATMTIASCTFAYMDPVAKKQMEKTINGPFNASVPFSSNVSLETTPLAFNFDLDLQHSLTSDGSGAFQFTPQFHHSIGSPNAGSGNGLNVNARYGGMYQMMGLVSSVATGSFAVLPFQAANMMTFAVNESTEFRGTIGKLSDLGPGMGVLVTAILQADGSLLAKRVNAVMKAGGAMGGGIITAVTGMPATQLNIVMQNGAGASVNTDYLSKTLTVNLTDSTTYEIDTDRISLQGLPFQVAFDASNIYVGQSVDPFSDQDIVSGTCDPSCGTITASTVRLREQGFRGTTDADITPGATTSFTLKLMPDCAFTTLTGATEIVVHQQAGTNVEQSTAIPAGTTLRVHGLLFSVGGQWMLAASTIASA